MKNDIPGFSRRRFDHDISVLTGNLDYPLAVSFGGIAYLVLVVRASQGPAIHADVAVLRAQLVAVGGQFFRKPYTDVPVFAADLDISEVQPVSQKNPESSSACRLSPAA